MRQWLAAVAVVFLAACGSPAPKGGVAGETATPSSAPTPTASATPMPTPQPTVIPAATPSQAPVVPPFACRQSAAGGSSAAASAVAAVRVGSHDGYDRFVVEFTGPVPAYEVVRQAGTRFTLSPSGQEAQLEGTDGVLVRIAPIADWTSYSAAMAFKPGYPYLREARLIENFEAVQQWALGVQGAPCLRVLALDDPARLVIDVAPA